MKQLQFNLEDPVLAAICAADPKMASLIRHIGGYALDLRSDYFPSLVRSIIGQQLSVKAAHSIWSRVEALCRAVTPETVMDTDGAALQNAGLSRTKVAYLKDLAQQVASGEMDLTRIDSLPDHEVINSLVRIKGIGVWTAEMFLIFSLGRLDVLSMGDLGLKRSIQWLYGLKKTPAERTIRSYGRKWAPYRTVASLYLWEAINRGLIKNPPDALKEL